ncbi:hypothetical protein AUP68_15792 [Ilyonectria robusta]
MSWDTGNPASGKVGLQNGVNFPGLQKILKLLAVLVAASISIGLWFTFARLTPPSVIPSGSLAHDGSDAPGSSPLSERPDASENPPVDESPVIPESTPIPEGESKPAIPPPKQWDVSGWPMPEDPPRPLRNDRRFVVIVPATSPSVDLCKVMFTAMALGYPAPILVGWGMDHRTLTKWDGGQNIIKVPAVLGYLDSVLRADAHPSEKLEDDDIVLIVDAFDVWFQLPPEVLLQRYHNINENANARLREQWQGPGPVPMYQTVVAGSEKNCWPRPWIDGNNLQCPYLPDSPIREDLYGPETDKNQTISHDLRPRYINGGVYMGEAGDMRRLFRRGTGTMMEKIDKGMHIMSEQGITGQVFGEQEVWRQWRRENPAPMSAALALVERDFEYHIGLDYYQVITVQTQNGKDDGRILTLNNQTAIDEYSQDLGIQPVRLQGVPDDIRTARNPLEGLVDKPDWGEMPLYADFFTESVPVILHHNGIAEGQKARRWDWWHMPWFFKHLRQLLQRRLMPGEPAVLATVQTENGPITYRPLDAETLGKKPRWMKSSVFERMEEVEFDAICGAPNELWWDEIFRDGQGPLV